VGTKKDSGASVATEEKAPEKENIKKAHKIEIKDTLKGNLFIKADSTTDLFKQESEGPEKR